MARMQHPALYPPILAFIAGIGLPIAERALPDPTFLPGIAIRDGGLLVDPDRLEWPADLLHEAGHLAVLSPASRALAHDDLPGHDHAADAGEAEALAWAWAAAMHLGIPPEALIHEGGYRGLSRELLQMYAIGIYPGLRGLCALGMTSAPGFDTPQVDALAIEPSGVRMPAADAPVPQASPIRYPKMHCWLRT